MPCRRPGSFISYYAKTEASTLRGNFPADVDRGIAGQISSAAWRERIRLKGKRNEWGGYSWLRKRETNWMWDLRRISVALTSRRLVWSSYSSPWNMTLILKCISSQMRNSSHVGVAQKDLHEASDHFCNSVLTWNLGRVALIKVLAHQTLMCFVRKAKVSLKRKTFARKDNISSSAICCSALDIFLQSRFIPITELSWKTNLVRSMKN